MSPVTEKELAELHIMARLADEAIYDSYRYRRPPHPPSPTCFCVVCEFYSAQNPGLTLALLAELNARALRITELEEGSA